MLVTFAKYFIVVLLLSLAIWGNSGRGNARSSGNPDTVMGSTWIYNSSFLYATGSVSSQSSGESYRHNAMTYGSNRSSTGGSTPAQVKVRVTSYETSNVHPNPCQNRSSNLITGNGQVNSSTSYASVFPCGGSPGGFHTYWGFGFHWVGTLYAQTDTQ